MIIKGWFSFRTVVDGWYGLASGMSLYSPRGSPPLPSAAAAAPGTTPPPGGNTCL